MNLSLPNVSFILKVAISLVIVSLILRAVPQLEPLRRQMVV